jgi:hypothetical protein
MERGSDGSMSAKTNDALRTRHRMREQRLAEARERRLRLDPNQVAREQRIDEAAVDVEEAWEARAAAQVAGQASELGAARAIERLVKEKLTVADVCALTGLDQTTVRRLRQLKSADGETGGPKA